MQANASPTPPTMTAPRPIRVDSLGALPWVIHAFSTRPGGVTTTYGQAGDLNLGFTPQDTREAVLANRQRFLDTVSSGSARLVTVRQVHATNIVRFDLEELSQNTEADGLITAESGLLLGILTADCVPVLVADPVNRAVAAVHAGWRGTKDRIVERGIARMTEEFGSNPDQLIAAIGPSIGVCCYSVGEEVRDAFSHDFSYADALFTPDRRLDLKQANRHQLLAAGLDNSRITVVNHCTSCEPSSFFSHRAQQGVTGRMLSIIGTR